MFDRSALNGIHGIHGIYAIVRRETGELYIGSSVNVYHRLCSHLSALRRGKNQAWRLQDAWDEHGEAAFLIVLLERVSERTAIRDREQYWLDRYRPYEVGRGYNRAHTVLQAGWKWTDEQRSRFSEQQTGRKMSPETRRRMCASQQARPDKDRRRALGAQVGKTNLGKKHSAERNREKSLRLRATEMAQRKLTDEHVAIVKRCLLDGVPGADIARKFGVSPSSVSLIQCGKKRAHVEPAPPGTVYDVPVEFNPGGKLSPDDIAQIKRSLLNGESRRALADQFGVGKTAIANIHTGRQWADVEPASHDPSRAPAPRLLNGQSKLTVEQVSLIKRRLADGVGNATVAREFHISAQAVGSIKSGKNWADVEPSPADLPSAIPAPRASREGVITHEPLRLF